MGPTAPARAGLSVRGLPPNIFAMVMATGIVSLAVNGAGHAILAHILFWLNVGLYAILLVLLLIRLEDGRLVAFGQQCSHLSCAVIPEPERGQLRCPCHNGYFEINEGRPIAGPPRRPLPRVRLAVRDGGIYATGVELRTV